MKRRLSKLQDRLANLGIDALLISQPENRRYLSGFTGSAGYLLISVNHAILATDFRYIEQASLQAPDYEVFRIDGSLAGYLNDLCSKLDVRRLGFEAANVVFSFYEEVSAEFAKSHLEFVPIDSMVESLRAIKDEGELVAIRRAVQIADAAFEQVALALRVGMTEREIAWDLEKHMRELGAEGLAFETIVASGPSSALPHARPTDRPLIEGDPIVIDMGAKVEGYCSDLTRTLILGEPTERFKEIYSIVLGAQQAAIVGMHAGMTGREADALARDYITKAGFGPEFGHSLGHGIGLAAHELPWVRRTSEEVLKEDMVTSIEPGIYLPGWGGVRIEDLAVVHSDGVEVLSQARKLSI